MGLSSGMDTDFIIQQTMRMHQMRIDSRVRARTILEWRQATQTQVRDQIQSFRNTFLTTQGASGMLGSSAFNTSIATAAGRNADAVSVRALSGSTTNTVRIGAINQLARGAHVTSNAIEGNRNIASTATLGSHTFAGDKQVKWTRDAGTVTVGGQDIRIERNIATGAWSFFDSDGEEFKGAAVNANQLTFTAGGDSLTLNWNAATNMLTRTDAVENRFVSNISVNEQTIEVTASYSEEDGWSFTGPEGVTLERDENDILRATFGEGATAQTFVLGKWDGDGKSLTPPGDASAPVVFSQVTQETNVRQLVAESNITVNGQTVRINENMTINQMVSAVNNSGAGVRMSYEPLTGRFAIESTTLGSGSTLTLGEPDLSNLFNSLGITQLTATGQNAQVYVNGDLITHNSNTFTFGGVSITLNRVTEGGGTGAVSDTSDGNITVSLRRDATEAMDRIRTFVNAYNSIIARIEGLVRERKAPHEVSYGPLTDEEKRGMSDRQIEEWETIARKGILRNDQGLQNLANSLRRELFEAVNAAGMTPQQIGLSTGRHDSGTGGQIVIDEDRLRAALEENPDRVAEIFSGTQENRGLLWRMNDIMQAFTSSSQPRTIRSLEESIRRSNEQIGRMQDRMFAEEDRLYRQFAAMETALSRMQSQGDWFSAMLGGLQR